VKRSLLLVLLALALVSSGAVAAAPPSPVGPSVAAKTCRAGYVRATIRGEVKCLHSGQFCARSAESQYRRYRFTCKRGSDGRYRLYRR
jgi:hypothetical protein